MDLGSVVGLVCGLAAILVGNAIEGGHIEALLQPTAAMIVLGGTIGATMVSYPMPVFVRACKSMKTVFSEKKREPGKLIEEIVEYAQKARRDGIIALEQMVQKASHPFLTKALTMAVDGADSKSMRENLELMISHMEEEGEMPAKVWESAGGYSPTIGIIGAVMGLIHVMQNLSDVGAVGRGIAVAFVATIYGVGTANLVFLPAAGKLKLKHRADMIGMELMLEGALAIQEGQNPNLIKEKLQAFYSDQESKEKPAR
jgi:chemotaxis protein MotA